MAGGVRTQVGTRTKLAQGRENKAAAEDALLDLLNERRHYPDRKTYPQLTVRDLCDKFLDWVELHRAPDTYDDYRDWLKKWVKLHGTTRARDIQALDLEEWKQKLAKQDLSPWTVNHAIISVKTCWSWGFKNDFLPVNPLQKVQKLDTEGRERTFTAGRVPGPPATFRCPVPSGLAVLPADRHPAR